MSGHANRDEVKKITALENKIDFAVSTIDELLELGTLYIEPSHQEDKAIRIFEAILLRDPNNVPAKFFLAYCNHFYLLDDNALQKASKLLQSIITNPSAQSPYVGASYLLLAGTLEKLKAITDEKISQLYKNSVESEPTWVRNRISLASSYKKIGQFTDALIQLEQALKNIMLPDSIKIIPNSYFASCVGNEYTGWDKTRGIRKIQEDIEEIQKLKLQNKKE